ncbi:MAG TPA: hypothetical protein DCL73_05400 [Treponema sp.]|nr:hypothetical protein [Treponema sp.]
MRKKTTEKLSKNKKLLCTAGLIAAAAVLAACIIVFGFAHRKPAAAFYGLSESARKAIASELPDFTLITYDASKPLAAQLKSGKKADILFTYAGTPVTDAALFAQKNKVGLAPSVLEGMISSAGLTAPRGADGTVLAVPLLIDNYEIDINRSMMRDAGYASLDSWAELDKFARNMHGKITAPVVMAGGDDRELINITGALCEALQGKAARNNVAAKIRESVASGKNTETDFEAVVSDLCASQESPLYMTDRLLSSWYKDGILYPETFHMKNEDVRAFMENELCAIVFQTLTQHRTVAQQKINNYNSQYYPSSPGAAARNFTSPMIFAVPLRNDRRAGAVITSLAKDKQEQISRATGLAPVQANSRVPDRQADDVRYWVAASGEPLPALADDAFGSDADRAAFAQAIRIQILYK